MIPNEYFDTFDHHLMQDKKPSDFFYHLIESDEFPNKEPFNHLSFLIKIEQNPKYHPEGNVWNHTMQVVDHAAIYSKVSQNPHVFMWSALLHDIGKGTTTRVRKGKITSYDHDTEGAKLSEEFLRQITTDEILIQEVPKMVRWHMQPLFVTKKLPFAKLQEMISTISASEIGLFSLCDRLGRGEMTIQEKANVQSTIQEFLETCRKKVHSPQEKQRIEEVLSIIKETKDRLLTSNSALR